MDSPLGISFLLYLLCVLLVAFVAYRVTKNLSDYVLGGRRLNGPVAALSAGASDMSAWLLLGLPGAAYLFGVNQIWIPVGLIIGAYLNWLLVAKPLRVYTEVVNDSLTIPAFLDQRLRDKNHRIRMLSTLSTLIFFTAYTVSGLIGGALLMSQAFGLEYELALFSGAAIIVAYTFVGGFLAVSWTDFFQGTFMFLCLLFIPIAAMMELGGVIATRDAIHAMDISYLDPFATLSAFGVVNLLAWGLGYFGQPHILVRFMAVRSVADIPIARRVAMTWMTLSLLGAVLTGMVGIAYFGDNVTNHESVFIMFAQRLFSPALSGVVLAAILSSIMCAIDSQMLASTSALTEDIYHAFLRPQATQKELVWVGRLGLIALAVLSIFLALRIGGSVLNLVSFAWAGLAASFAAPVCFSLFWRKMTAKGAVWGILFGALTVILWAACFKEIWKVYEIIPGICMSILGCVLGSYFDVPPCAAQTAEFDTVWKKIKETAY